MIPELGVLLLLLLFGGWVATDSTSFGQFMVSRPVVAATLAGWMAGDAAAGALVGLILEALNLTVLPVGASRYPEGGPAAVVAGALVARSGADTATLLTAVVFALSWAWVAGVSVRHLRQYNIRLMSPETMGDSKLQRFERHHLLAVGLDFLRGVSLVAVGVPVLYLLLWLASQAWGIPDAVGRAVLWGVAAAGIGATLRLFGERRAGLFAAGVLGGLLVLVLW